MTWKRVATAAVLIPFVVGLVLWGSTAIVAIALALVTLLALFEYFALGEAIGHRAYRFWTAICALFLIYVQWLMGDVPTYKLSGGLIASQRIPWLANGLPSLEAVFFLFVLGIAALTLWTRRPTPSRGSAACCGNQRQWPDFGGVSVIVCSSASRGWHARAGDAAVRAGHYLGGRYGGLFRRASRRQTCFGAAPESEENVGGDGREFPRLTDRRSHFCALHHCAASASSCDGCCRQRGGASGRSSRIGVQAQRGDQGFR